MSKSQSQTASSQSHRPSWLVRPHPTDKGLPMSGDFDLNGVVSYIYLYADGQVQVHKRLKDGAPGKQPIATGKVKPSRSTNPAAPALFAELLTGKGTRIPLAFWWHPDTEGHRPFYAVRHDEPLPPPKGEAFDPSSF